MMLLLAGLAEPFSPVQGETAMWRAVILQALLDAVSNSGKEEARRHKDEARRWLLSGSQEFADVCHMAGFAPGYILRMVKAALARNCQWRADIPKAASAAPFAWKGRLARPAFPGGRAHGLDLPALLSVPPQLETT